MRYLITGIGEPFYTQWYNIEFHKKGMIVYDLQDNEYTENGKLWKNIELDEL